jgi:hypothetical protein
MGSAIGWVRVPFVVEQRPSQQFLAYLVRGFDADSARGGIWKHLLSDARFSRYGRQIDPLTLLHMPSQSSREEILQSSDYHSSFEIPNDPLTWQ